MADRNGLPIAAWVASGECHESKLVIETLEERFVAEAPERLIGDKAYDSDALGLEVSTKIGSKLIARHRSGRKRPNTQDGRELRRYRRRWKIERVFAWLLQFRRIVTRWEFHADNFLAFVHLGCLVILLRQLLRCAPINCTPTNHSLIPDLQPELESTCQKKQQCFERLGVAAGANTFKVCR